jgi:hypothetical protein
MVRNSNALKISGLILAVCIAGSGCVGLRGRVSSNQKDGATGPAQIQSVWLKQVQFLPDTQNQGSPSPALVGSVYFYPADVAASHNDVNAKKAESTTADGQLVIEVYDVSAGGEPKPLATTTYPAEVLATRKQQDPLLGSGYSVAVPLGSYSKEVTRVQIALRFEPAKGGQALMCRNEPMTLDAGKSTGVIPASSRNIVVPKS